MDVSKVKYNRKVQIDWSTAGKGDERVDHSITCNDRPAPGFVNALQGFTGYTLRELDLPDEKRDLVEVIAVSLSRDKDDYLGVVVTAKREVPAGSVTENTPLRREAGEDAVGPRVLTDEDLDLVDTLIQEAVKYINGHREQAEMDLGSDEPDPGSNEAPQRNEKGQFTGAKG